MPPIPRTDSPDPDDAHNLLLWARRFPPTGWGVRAARGFAVGAVEAGLRAAPVTRSPTSLATTAADAGLVTSELASNAVRHAATPFEVLVDLARGCVRIEVRDGSDRLPRQEDTSGGATGRGLMVVDRIASAWGSAPTGRGKVVWAELPVGGAVLPGVGPG
jgi:hypothetical protein